VLHVVAAGAKEGLEVRPHVFTNETRTSIDAAREIGCAVAQIAKTLVFEAGGEPVIFIMSGSNRVDIDKAASAVGGEVSRADARKVKEATGYSIGATPPFGHATTLRIYMDEDLLAHEEVWAASGRPDAVFPADPHDLAKAAGATIGDLKQESPAQN
jgi:Cys-tRNA(Pro) deacylase